MSDVTVPVRYTRVRIPYSLEQDLDGVALVVNDPTRLHDLRYVAPPTDQELTYVGRYDHHEKLRCAFLGHKHQKGYVFRDDDGSHYLIGNTCGRTQLGMAAWKEFTEQIEALEERARDQATLRRLREDLGRHRDWIAELARNRSVTALSAMRKEVGAAAQITPLVRRVADAHSRDDGQVTHLVEVRDFAAEERERERLAREAERDGTAAATIPRPTIMKKERQVMGTLRGRIVTASGPDPRTAIAAIPQLVTAFLTTDVLKLVGSGLTTLIKNARIIGERVGLLRDQVADARAFFDPTNLELLRAWAASQPGLRTRVIAGPQSVRFEADGRLVTVSAPPPFTPEDEEHFDDLATSVGATPHRAR